MLLGVDHHGAVLCVLTRLEPLGDVLFIVGVGGLVWSRTRSRR
ncbi:hypothetical protein [Nocardia jiangxiensis]|nr:hypothetical protein [Nocardia jiangxiensis]